MPKSPEVSIRSDTYDRLRAHVGIDKPIGPLVDELITKWLDEHQPKESANAEGKEKTDREVHVDDARDP